MSEWQPIETAPLETPVLVWLPPGSRNGACGTFKDENLVAVAVLREDYFNKYHDWPKEKAPDKWYGDIVYFDLGYESTGSYTVDIELHPTHWMPLPPPPEAAE